MADVNLANAITVLRFFLAFAGLTLLLLPLQFWNAASSLALFLLAAFSDYLDGAIARRFALVSPIGKVLDPLADKVLVLLYIIVLAQLSYFPLWLVLITVARDLIHDSLRGFFAAKGHIIGANAASKWKTAFQMLAIILALVLLTQTLLPPGASLPPAQVSPLPTALLCISAIFGVVGTWLFIMRNRALFTQ